jgi:hypothetical protein
MLRALPHAIPLLQLRRGPNAVDLARVAPFLVLLALGICQFAWQSIVPSLLYGASCPAGTAIFDESNSTHS